ncbi:hypothetical protein KY366_03305 [Candidatus Woesearchaeota archaeon]|nr:hypothetical protein [Candidatus Woesearchaeota archaeon]
MRKIMTCLIMVLFLLSVVAAQPLAAGEREQKALSAQNTAAVNKPVPARQAKVQGVKTAQERKIQKSDELKSIKANPKLVKYKENLAFKAREITKTKLATARQNYVKAKERYQTAKQNYVAAHERFREAKQRIANCKDEDGGECAQLTEQIRDRAKESLLKTADRIIEHLNKVKANVESNEDLSEEEAADIVEKIDAMIEEVEEAKSAAESAESKEDVIEATKTIKQAWLRNKKRLTIHTGRIVNARIGGIIVKIKRLEVKLETILERMEEKGLDTSEIQSMVDQFNEKTEEAKESYENALDKFKEAASAEDVESAHELAVEGHRYMKAAQQSLQEAQKLLRDIVHSIRQAGGQEEMAAVAGQEVETEGTEGTETGVEDETGVAEGGEAE